MYVKNDVNPASFTFPVDMNELCVSHDKIWTYMNVLGRSGNANLHSLVDIILSPFGNPTVIFFWNAVCS